MADPSNLYQHLPDAYSRSSDADLYKLLSGLAEGTETARANVLDYREDLHLSKADGPGLDRAGQNYGISRPPGMTDALYQAVCLKMAGMRRGTVAAIKVLLDTATGLSWTVEDKQLNGSIPAGEVHCSLASGFYPLYGRGLYAGITANTGDPVESSIAGTILDELGEAGGTYNDHAGGIVDPWVRAWVEKVKLAGTKIVYNGA